MDSKNKPKRGRPKKNTIMDTLAVRLPHDLVNQIDNYVDKLQTDFLA